MDDRRTEIDRRGVLGLAAAAAAAVAAAPAAATEDEQDRAPESPPGYRVTEHVSAAYARMRF